MNTSKPILKLVIMIFITQLLTGCIVTEAINDIATDYKWQAQGIDNKQAWQKYGVETPEEAKKWLGLLINANGCSNFLCEEKYVYNWKIKRGIKTPEEARLWLNSSLTRSEIFPYLDAGVTSVETAEKWKKLASRAKCGSYAERCIKAGITNPDNVVILLNAGLNISEILAYIPFGVNSIKQAIAFNEAGVSAHQIDLWREKGVTIDKAILELAKKAEIDRQWGQLNTENPHMWKNTGLLTLDEAKVWVAAKISDAPYWINAGITNANVAKKWVIAGFPDGYKWSNSGIKTLDEAIKWKKLGADLGLAAQIKKESHITIDNLTNSCRSILSASDFMSANPYKHVNKCVATCIHVNQIISANQVFASTSYNPVRMISATAPHNLTDDFVVNRRACGIYNIQSAEQFELTDGSVVMGNAFNRVARNKE